MNQILVSEKLYVTPAIRKKKKLFKVEFFLSIFLLCALSIYAIYSEYDRNKSEQVSKELLSGIEYKSTEHKLVLPKINTETVNPKNTSKVSQGILFFNEANTPSLISLSSEIEANLWKSSLNSSSTTSVISLDVITPKTSSFSFNTGIISSS